MPQGQRRTLVLKHMQHVQAQRLALEALTIRIAPLSAAELGVRAGQALVDLRRLAHMRLSKGIACHRDRDNGMRVTAWCY